MQPHFGLGIRGTQNMQAQETHVVPVLLPAPDSWESSSSKGGSLMGHLGVTAPPRTQNFNVCTSTAPGRAAGCRGKFTWHRGQSRAGTCQISAVAPSQERALARAPRCCVPMAPGAPRQQSQGCADQRHLGLACGRGRAGGYSCGEARRGRCL